MKMITIEIWPFPKTHKAHKAKYLMLNHYKSTELTEDFTKEALMNKDPSNSNIHEEVNKSLTKDQYEKLDDSAKNEIK